MKEIRFIIFLLVYSTMLNAMQLTPEQQKAEDKYLEARLSTMIPPDQVIYFLENMQRLLYGRHKFHNPLNTYLANDYTIALHYDPDLVKIYRTNDPSVCSDPLHFKKESSGCDTVEVTPEKFVEILAKIKRKLMTA